MARPPWKVVLHVKDLELAEETRDAIREIGHVKEAGEESRLFHQTWGELFFHLDDVVVTWRPVDVHQLVYLLLCFRPLAPVLIEEYD